MMRHHVSFTATDEYAIAYSYFADFEDEDVASDALAITVDTGRRHYRFHSPRKRNIRVSKAQARRYALQNTDD
jgi:hypothetical protein